MKQYEKLLARAIGEIMIDLGQKHDMDLDVNIIDYEALYEEAKKKVMKDPEFINAWKEHRFDEWATSDEDSLTMLKIIEDHENPYEIAASLDGVWLCEAAENMTCEQICDFVNPRYTFE